jgi:hypothetical protein
MIASAALLTNFEHCRRWGFYSKNWEKHKMSLMQMFHRGVRSALLETSDDPGQSAGEHLVTLAALRGIDIGSQANASVNLYRAAQNHAAIADLVTTVIRKDGRADPWLEIGPGQNGWWGSALLSPERDRLRQFLAVSSWSEERAFYERHSWYVLGEIAHYEMPLELVVAVLGPTVGGRRQSPWSKARFHRFRSHLRFRMHKRAKVEGFAESWTWIYREEHDEINRSKWLDAMMEDDVMQQSLFRIEVPVPEKSRLDKVRRLAQRQMENLEASLPGKWWAEVNPDNTLYIPQKQMTTCHNPLHPCPYRACCWSEPESYPWTNGLYDKL